MAKFSWKQRFFFIPPVILGGLLLIFAPGMKAEPPKATQTTGKKVVRVLKVVPRKIQPTAVGYGYTKPAHEWEAQAELDGTVIWISETRAVAVFDDDNYRENTITLKLDVSSEMVAVSGSVSSGSAGIWGLSCGLSHQRSAIFKT